MKLLPSPGSDLSPFDMSFTVSRKTFNATSGSTEPSTKSFNCLSKPPRTSSIARSASNILGSTFSLNSSRILTPTSLARNTSTPSSSSLVSSTPTSGLVGMPSPASSTTLSTISSFLALAPSSNLSATCAALLSPFDARSIISASRPRRTIGEPTLPASIISGTVAFSSISLPTPVSSA